MTARDEILQILNKRMQQLGLNDPQHVERLDIEKAQLDNQDEWLYFKGLVDSGVRFPYNENNLLIAFLLGLCDDFDISKSHIWIQGEYPDVDVDFLPIIQDYLRNDWAPREYGRQNVCNIGNYATFGIKMSLIDMARIFGEDREEVLALTTKLGLKDDEGHQLTWDKAVQMSEEFKRYCEKYPKVSNAAKQIVGRIRGRGKHAGGTIISNGPIHNVVPIMLDTDGNPVSAWTEGLSEQDLQPVGYIKFDVLAIKDLLRIAEICRLVKERRGIKSISALQGKSDWTDLSYLNDPVALALADQSKTRGVFQFDSQGMRRLLREGGVSDFDDLVAYTALFRPGPLNVGMHERFINRKRGKEPGWENEIPDLIKSILINTQGIFCYQEQVMQILHLVGNIPLTSCEKVRKAISKKRADEFAKYKQMFVENGQRNLKWSAGRVEDLFSQIESFAEYGFNKSHAVSYTYLSSRLLYLKAYYPLEFFTVTLRLESKDKKLWMYKRDANRMGIEVCPAELNKSNYTYDIVGDKIYTGYSNIKGIGIDVAKRIAENQPYQGIEDFLTRFGTDAKVLKALIMLGIFEGDRAHLWAFYEKFKEGVKKRKDREKRQMKTREKLTQQILDLLNPEGAEKVKKVLSHQLLMECDAIGNDVESQLSDGANVSDVNAIVKKYRASAQKWEEKERCDEERIFNLSNFNPSSLEEMPTIEDAENQFYGFAWVHPLETSPDYEGNKTFEDQFEEKDGGVLPVEVLLWRPPRERISQKNKPYYHVYVEDADRRQEIVTFWEEDFLRFEEELKAGNLLSMRVKRPSKGFNSFTFESAPKDKRMSRIPKKKEDDYRITILKNDRNDKR
jgi:DNA polymerase III alpha subunit